MCVLFNGMAYPCGFELSHLEGPGDLSGVWGPLLLDYGPVHVHALGH